MLARIGGVLAILTLVSLGRSPALGVETDRDNAEVETSSSPGDSRQSGTGETETADEASNASVAKKKTTASRQIVSLSVHEPKSDHDEYFSELLTREIVRQAVLIAARDGLGLTTRDAVLRDSLPGDESSKPEHVLDVDTHATAEGVLEITLSRGKEEQREVIWSTNVTLTEDPYQFYFPLLRAMEEASRGDLIAALTKAGHQGMSHAAGDAKPDGEIDESLAECTLASQYAAIRALHEQTQTAGESPELLGSLARGYAQLGYLTQHYWNTQCKALQARALLYAERLVATRPDEAASHWVRGYVRSWVGLHAAGLADLERAQELATTSGETAPDWVRVAELHCRYDFHGLDELAAKEGYRFAELAQLLAFMDMAQRSGIANTIEAGERALTKIPEAYIVYDRLTDFGGVSYGHMSTVNGSIALAEYLPRQTALMRGLPDDAKKAILETRSEGGLASLFLGDESAAPFSSTPRRVAEALTSEDVAADDRGEPSWTFLAHLYQEEDFVQTARRTLFLARSLGVPADDFVLSVAPNLAGHPYAAWIESLAIDEKLEADAHRAALLRVQVGDLNWRMYPFLREAYSTSLANHETGAELARRIMSRMDLVAVDIDAMVGWNTDEKAWLRKVAETCRPVDPQSPRLIAVLAEHSDVAQEQLDAWEKEFGDVDWILAALARRYTTAKRYADAERCLRRRIELSPDLNAYEQLADLYWAQDDKDRWRSTLEECLQHTDYGLSHAWVQDRLAHYFMDNREFEKARPYALGSAESWAYFGLKTGSECLEGLHEWDASEEWVKNAAIRYDSERLWWYFWCRRTGHGDVASAKVLAQQLVDEYNARTPVARQDYVGIYYLLAGDRKAGYDALLNNFNATKSYWSGLHVILLADEFDDRATRDSTRGFFAQYSVPDQSDSSYPLAKFFVLLQDAYASEDGELDLAAVDKVLAVAGENQRMDIAYFAARFLALHGKAAESEEYLKKCYGSTDVSQLNRTLAGADLIDAGQKAEDLAGPDGP